MKILSQKQQTRKDKLIKRYRGLGVVPAAAANLAGCVIERRGGFGLFRSCGVAAQGERPAVKGRVEQATEDLWTMRRAVGE